jgi:hypothetical protein
MICSWRVLLAGVLLLVPTLCASQALACSAPYCTPAAFSIPEGAVVPTNLAELSVFADSPVLILAGHGFRLRLWDASDPVRTLLAQGVGNRRASLTGLLVPGASYVAEATTCDDETLPIVRTLHFTVAATASDPPTSLGPLRVARSGRTIVGYGGGVGCFYELVAEALDLALDESALPEPWRELLSDYQLVVDGEPFTWLQTIGVPQYGPDDAARGFYFGAPGPFRAFTECEPSNGDSGETPPLQRPGLAPGKHLAWVTARVPTEPAMTIASEQIEIELSCPEPDESTDGGPEVDHDTSREEEEQDDDEAAEGASASSRRAGGCSLAREHAGDLTWLALVLLALVRLRRTCS